MPLLRKLIKVGNSRAIIIPPDWLKYHEDKTGQPVKVMLMEVDNIITLSPREERKSESERPVKSAVIEGLEKGERGNRTIIVMATGKPEEGVLIPNEEIILPYPDPEKVDTDDEDRLAVIAYSEEGNYKRIWDYVKQKQPTWKMVGLSMETVKKGDQRFFRVIKIINTTPVQESEK